MKLTNFKLLLPMLFALLLVTSCNNDSEPSLYDEWENILDNHGAPYSDDSEGHYFGVTSIGEENVKKYIAGHGWKCIDSWLIDSDGKRQQTSYWKDLIGASASVLYFNPDGTMREYAWNDAYGKRLYFERRWRWLEDEHNRTLNRIILGNSNDDYFQITGWNHDSFCAVEYLSVYGDGRKNYGVSIFQRLSAKELDYYNKNYKNIKDYISQSELHGTSDNVQKTVHK